ncbi:MAG TPA: hypothetical protein VF174_08030 [Micromonosporaceae bacterium]
MHNQRNTSDARLSSTAGTYLTVMAISGTALAGTLLAQLALHVARRLDRLEQRLDERMSGRVDVDPALWGNGGSVRRSPARRGERLALVEPAVDAAERRRLMEAHLRDQLAAELASKVDDAMVEGFAIGYRARKAEEPESDG